MAGLGETRVVSLSIIIMSLNNICDASLAGSLHANSSEPPYSALLYKIKTYRLLLIRSD